MQRSGISQLAHTIDLGFRCAGESDAPPDRGGPGTVDNRWRLTVPPVVEIVGQSPACVQERVGVLIAIAGKPTSTDAVVESKRVEVGLVGEVERPRHTAEPDEPQIAIGLRDDATREAFPGGECRAASGVANSEASGEWIEPVTGCGKRCPLPLVRMVLIDPPPRPRRWTDSKPMRTLGPPIGQD